MGKLDGKVAVITGAGRGLGAAHAKLLAEEGAAVAVNDVNEENAKSVVDEITGAGGQASVHVGVHSFPTRRSSDSRKSVV